MESSIMLKVGDKVGLVCMSNPQRRENRGKVDQLIQKLKNMGLSPVLGEHIYEASSGQERAQELMHFYRNEEFKAIFDISGGDLANGVLPYLDYEKISYSSKIFWGYSDLTTLVNAIYAKTGKLSVLYQIRNMLSEEHGEKQITDFRNTVMQTGRKQHAAGDDLFHIDYEFVQGNELRGEVVGGNIRCFLKLAGTPYMPELTGKILFLEARSGIEAQIETYMVQLSQMGAFERVSGVLLGTFTQLEAIKEMPKAADILKKYVREDLPIAITSNIGHGTDSKAIWIGKELGKDNYNETTKKL